MAEQVEVVGRLARESKLSDEEADAMLLAISADMANWERTLGEQQARQRARLAERLLRRQQLLAASQKGAIDARDDVEARLAVKEHQLDILQREKGLTDKQREETIDRYRQDLVRLYNAQEESK